MNKKDTLQHLFTNEQLHLDYESNGESSGSGARLTHLNKLSYWNLTRRKGSLLCVGVVTGGGGGSLIWPPRCAAEQGTVFKDLSLKQGMQFHP